MAKVKSFRRELLEYGVGLIMIATLPLMAFFGYRPWDRLNTLIEKGKIIVNQADARIDKKQISRLAELAKKTALSKNENISEDYLVFSFGMIALYDKLLPEAEARAILKKEKNFDLDYKELGKAYLYWRSLLTPEILEAIINTKKTLVAMKKSSLESGFKYDDVYYLADMMPEVGATKLWFLADGVNNWWEATYPGLGYDTWENKTPELLNYRQIGAGFYHNPTHYRFGIFPKIDRDEWGEFFSAWKWVKGKSLPYAVSIDFRADTVVSLMKSSGLIAGIILAVDALLLFVVSFLSTRKIIKPIKELMNGIQEVLNGNYTVKIVPSGSLEFRRLIDFFNDMTKKLFERFNLKEILKMLSSEELVQRVEENGLDVLKPRTDTITVLKLDFASSRHICQFIGNIDAFFNMLREYYQFLDDIIYKFGGYVDDRAGDSILALFNAPFDLKDHTTMAIQCAIEMQTALRIFNQDRRLKGLPVFEARIGVNCGSAMIGALGSRHKMKLTAIGDTMNDAARFEAASDIAHILIADEVYKKINLDAISQIARIEGRMPLATKDGLIHGYKLFIDGLIVKQNREPKSMEEVYEYSKAA